MKRTCLQQKSGEQNTSVSSRKDGLGSPNKNSSGSQHFDLKDIQQVKRKKDIMRVLASVVLFALIMFSCDLIPENILPDDWLPDKKAATSLTTEDAKVEMRSANQDLTTQKEEISKSTGFSALLYLMELMEMEDDYELKSAKLNTSVYKKRLSYSNVFNYFRDKNSLKSVTVLEEEGMYGVYKFNFNTSSFDLIEESNTKLQYIYPSDDAALYSKNNNADLLVNNLEFTEVTSYEDVYDYSTNSYVKEETTESLPVEAKITLKIDGKVELTSNFSASYSKGGMPVSMECDMKSGDYSMSVVQKEKTTGSNAKVKFIEGGETLIDSDMNITYNSDKSAVKKYEGFVIVSPLKFEGTVNAEAIEKHTEEYQESGTEPDLDFLNKQLDVEVFQYEDNAKIGYLAYYMYYDAEEGESVPALAIVYEDGTYEWLDEVITVAEL